MRRMLLISAIVSFAPSPVLASSITINWVGPVIWYNNDWLTLCRDTGSACEFWNGLQSLGISIAPQVSETPLRLSMTFRDAMPDAFGVYNTTADIHLEFGRLSIVSAHTSMSMGNGLGAFSRGAFGLFGQFDPATPPLAGYNSQRPQFFNIANFGFHSGANTSLVETFLQQPLSALSAVSCISLGGDCDLVVPLTPASISVPE
jgi:hypothetical protein